MRKLVLVSLLSVAMLALPSTAASASTHAAPANGPVIKVGILTPTTSATAANPDTADAFNAAIAAFNKRGGAGKNHSKLKGIVCDTKGDANGEVDCARKMVDEGVVATLGDLTYNNPSGVVNVLEQAGIPRIGLLETDLAEFQSSVSWPLSAGAVGGYVGDAVGLNKKNKNKAALVRTDAATGSGFRAFIAPPFKQAGVDIVGDVAIATGSTDYSPYVSDVQNSGADAAVLAIGSDSASQFIAAMAQLNSKLPLAGLPGTFTLATLRKFKDTTKGTILSDSFPYPSLNNIKAFPGLKQFFADMKASGKKDVAPANLKPTAFSPWLSVLAFVKLSENLDTVTKDNIVQSLKTSKDIDLNGLTPPWTPSTPGFSLFKTTSNHFVYLSTFDGKNPVTNPKAIDISQYFNS
jgi:ABC-type branched-subunit amino acid transport system substrate-binding protein